MVRDGVEGFLIDGAQSGSPCQKALDAMNILMQDESLRLEMGSRGKDRFLREFDLDSMVSRYRDLILTVAPPVILIDIDTTIAAWNETAIVNRGIQINRECTPGVVQNFALNRKDNNNESWTDCEHMDPEEGAIAAIKEMIQDGLDIYICSSFNNAQV